MGWGGGVGTAFPALMSISFTSYVAKMSKKEKNRLIWVCCAKIHIVQDEHSHIMYAYLLSLLCLLHSLLSGNIEGVQHRSRSRRLRKEWLKCSRLTSLESRERWSALIVLAIVTKTTYKLKRGQDNVSNALEQKIVPVRTKENCSAHVSMVPGLWKVLTGESCRYLLLLLLLLLL